MGNQIQIGKDYAAWIGELKLRIRQSQIKAAVKVNTELLQLYWQLGSDIVEKQKSAKFRYKDVFPIATQVVPKLECSSKTAQVKPEIQIDRGLQEYSTIYYGY